MAVALSEDGGLTFPLIRHMELGEGFVGEENSTNNRQYEYPYLMQGKDGMLHLAFAYQTRRDILRRGRHRTQAGAGGRLQSHRGQGPIKRLPDP